MTGEVVGKITKGKYVLLADTAAITTVFAMGVRRTFSPESIIVTNLSAVTRVQIFDCQSSEVTGRRLDLIVGPTTTAVLKKEELIGIEDFMSSVVAAASVSGVTYIHVGGYEE